MKKKFNGSLYLFADRLPPTFGGMENHALHFIRFFINHVNFPLHAIISKNDDGINIFWSPDGTKFKTCQTNYNLLKNIIKTAQSETIICFFNSGRWIEELIEIRDKLPNAIFIQRTGGNDIIQANLSDLSFDLKYRQNVWAKIINNNIDTLISNSDYTTKRLIKIGVQSHKILKISGGIDSDACVKALRQRDSLRKKLFPNLHHKKIVLFAARFVEFKGFPFTIAALKNLIDKDDKIVLSCIGDGKLKDKYIDLGEQELGNRFKYCGGVDADSSLEYIAASDLLVSSSRFLLKEVPNGKYVHTETMGRVLYEAIGCGTRIVATNVGGVAEVVKPKYGTLVEPENTSSLSSAILYELAQKRIDFSEILSFHKVFSWENVFNRYLILFKKLTLI